MDATAPPGSRPPGRSLTPVPPCGPWKPGSPSLTRRPRVSTPATQGPAVHRASQETCQEYRRQEKSPSLLSSEAERQVPVTAKPGAHPEQPPCSSHHTPEILGTTTSLPGSQELQAVGDGTEKRQDIRYSKGSGQSGNTANAFRLRGSWFSRTRTEPVSSLSDACNS